MALTTSDATKLTSEPVTDVNANTSISSGRARQISPEVAILFNKSIVARPLAVPEVCSIRVKNTEYRYRWVNRVAMNGGVYTQRKAQGFTNATKDDVEVLGGDVVAGDGEITAGDLILMKIQADKYDAAIKWNMEKASLLTRARGVYLDGASSDVHSDSQVSRKSVAQEPFLRSGQVKPFIPENADAIVDDSIKSGRVEQTRRTMEELRQGAQSEK